MRSPIDPGSLLQQCELEQGLAAYQCPKSGGVWIPLQSYLDWKGKQPESLPASEPAVPAFADDSKQRALICPESGRLLLRYRVGHGLQFHVDQSPATGGVWLDKGEWEALKSKGLHVHLNLIFTAAYQRQLRTEEYQGVVERAFCALVGEADFQKASEFKQWIAHHPRRSEILGYLLNHADAANA